MEKYGALELTESSRPLLRGELTLSARKVTKPEKSTSGKKAKAKSELRSMDQELFEALRKLRTELADEQGVPPYVIFSDASLVEMARQRPQSDDTFKFIHGVGEMKLKRYGDRFMQVVRDYPLPKLLNNNFSDTINETLTLHNEGLSVAEISAKRDLSISTIYTHLADVISAGMLKSWDVLDLEDEDIATIQRTAEFLNSKEEGALKPLFEELDGEWNYGVLRCVVSAL